MAVTRPRVCLLGQHEPEDHWILRPALVGAGISIEFVHYDRPCRRCLSMARIEWRRILGDRAALDQPLGLTEWLSRHGASIEAAPEGEVRVPPAAELERMVGVIDGNRAQRRARRRG